MYGPAKQNTLSKANLIMTWEYTGIKSPSPKPFCSILPNSSHSPIKLFPIPQSYCFLFSYDTFFPIHPSNSCFSFLPHLTLLSLNHSHISTTHQISHFFSPKHWSLPDLGTHIIPKRNQTTLTLKDIGGWYKINNSRLTIIVTDGNSGQLDKYQQFINANNVNMTKMIHTEHTRYCTNENVQAVQMSARKYRHTAN